MIHFNILLNALIIIILLHLLISNFSENEHFEVKEEKEKIKSKPISKSNKPNEKDSLEYLENLNETDLTFQNMDNKNNNKNKNKINTITPANTFDRNDNLNHPNFESNVLDYTKFYKINNQDNTLKSNKRTFIDTNTPQNSVSISPRPFPNADNGKIASRPSRNLPDRWTYSNELPMNGGMFGSIVGLDSNEGLYSSYNSGNAVFKKCAQENISQIPHNDLRKPIVYN